MPIVSIGKSLLNSGIFGIKRFFLEELEVSPVGGTEPHAKSSTPVDEDM